MSKCEKSCEDCIHYGVCEYKGDMLCDYFKDKSLCVEVVRCKDCVHYNGHRYCEYFATPVLDNDYCSYAERKLSEVGE